MEKRGYDTLKAAYKGLGLYCVVAYRLDPSILVGIDFDIIRHNAPLDIAREIKAQHSKDGIWEAVIVQQVNIHIHDRALDCKACRQVVLRWYLLSARHFGIKDDAPPERMIG